MVTSYCLTYALIVLPYAIVITLNKGKHTMKIDPATHKDIIEAYTIDLWPLREIGDVLHVSPTAIRNILRKHGIDTSKHKITTSCTTCGKSIKRTRKRVRKQLNHFCCTDCYTVFLDAGKTSYNSSSNSSHFARRVVAHYFDLQPGNIVHHEDGKRFNNLLHNLKVFKNQGDHIKYHHQMRDKYHNKITSKERARQRESWFRCYQGTPVEILWDGSKL